MNICLCGSERRFVNCCLIQLQEISDEKKREIFIQNQIELNKQINYFMNRKEIVDPKYYPF